MSCHMSCNVVEPNGWWAPRRQRNGMQCDVVQCNVLYRTVRYRTAPYCAVLYCTVLCRTVPYRTVLYRTVPYCTIHCRNIPYCTVQPMEKIRIFEIAQGLTISYFGDRAGWGEQQNQIRTCRGISWQPFALKPHTLNTPPTMEWKPQSQHDLDRKFFV